MRQLADDKGPFGLPADPLPSLANISTDIVSGLVEAFLHKQNMPKEELDCLVNGTAEFAGSVMEVASHTVMLTQEILGIRNPEPKVDATEAKAKMVNGMKKLVKGLEEETAVSRRRLSDGANALEVALSASQIFIELGLSIQKIALLSRNIMKNCIRGEAKDALVLAGKHMRSMDYISGHILANGADVVDEVGDAVKAWNHKDNRKFGYQIGKALRKVILSNSTNGTLPEGPPSEFVIGNITVGLADGFLGKGFSLDINLLDSPENSVHIDLRRCVGKNLFFFQSAWSATMYFFAKQEAQNQKNMFHYKESKDRFGKQLAFTMMQLPHAMKTCSINQEQEQALMDSIKAFGSGLQFHFDVPGKQTGLVDKMEEGVSKAVKEWADSHWYNFGFELGKLLQRAVLVIFPQQYSVDATGLLEKRTFEVSVVGRRLRLLAAPAAFAVGGLAVLLGGRRAVAARRCNSAQASTGAPAWLESGAME